MSNWFNRYVRVNVIDCEMLDYNIKMIIQGGRKTYF